MLLVELVMMLLVVVLMMKLVRGLLMAMVIDIIVHCLREFASIHCVINGMQTEAGLLLTDLPLLLLLLGWQVVIGALATCCQLLVPARRTIGLVGGGLLLTVVMVQGSDIERGVELDGPIDGRRCRIALELTRSLLLLLLSEGFARRPLGVVVERVGGLRAEGGG